MSKSGQGPSVQNAKLVIVTTLITGLITLATAFIGIIPSLRSGDLKQIEQLNQKINSLTPKVPVPVKTMGITGTVRSEDNTKILVGYDVYLLPESYPLLSARTDDNGKFTLEAIPADMYSIIVRDANDGKSGKALLDGDAAEVQMNGARVAYQIKR
jgi:hypothetical protein